MIATGSNIQMWGGIEPSIIRVNNEYYDQIKKTGHEERGDEDLEAIADLGVKVLRYPALWERTAPKGVEHADFTWLDKRLYKLKALGIEPILGLLHHGSGPKDTDLLDPQFPEKLAEYAGVVAQRYPYITYYTPINEPLTTARFSALYGHWYPHEKNESSFLRGVFNQAKATVLAMDAIRQVNPHAQLVTTEDIGEIYSTPRLAYQAAFENERRWLSYDLLTGQFRPGYRMWYHALHAGISEEELFADQKIFDRPDIQPNLMGVNIYVTSFRYLDERIEIYPEDLHGGNGIDIYADTEAVRVPHGIPQISSILCKVWNRYHIPLIITEAHLGCDDQIEQKRWLYEMWKEAHVAQSQGVDIRAVTSWGMLGMVDWKSLCTRDENYYERGVFDVSSGHPHPTILTSMVKDLATKGSHDDPIIKEPGWWKRDGRVIFQSNTLHNYSSDNAGYVPLPQAAM